MVWNTIPPASDAVGAATCIVFVYAWTVHASLEDALGTASFLKDSQTITTQSPPLPVLDRVARFRYTLMEVDGPTAAGRGMVQGVGRGRSKDISFVYVSA